MPPGQLRRMRMSTNILDDSNLSAYEKHLELMSGYMQKEKKIAHELRYLTSLKNSKIPEKYINANLNVTKNMPENMKVILKLLQNYCNHFHERKLKGECLVFTGQVGCGKTYLACSILHKIIEMGYTGKYVIASDFFQELKDSISREKRILKTDYDIIYSLLPVDLLIIDEITSGVSGSEYLSDYEKRMLYNIVNKRYQKNKLTLAITNEPSEVIGYAIGERSWDRLKENAAILAFDWQSIRCNPSLVLE